MTCKVYLDNLAIPLPSTDRAWFLTLRYDGSKYQGLVVQKVKIEEKVYSGDNKNMYARIGMFSVTRSDFEEYTSDLLGWETKVTIV